jgi:diguanylate cyclase (GGDEF)-like protein/hemerythrin-like metal-binding protein
VVFVALLVRQLRTDEQLRRLSDTALAIARGDRQARCALPKGPLAQFSRDFDDMAMLLNNEIRSLRATQRELEQLIATDRLTGVGNRRQFEQQAEAEAARSKRYGIPVSLVLFDVDYFKRINDTFGHQVGDAVLVALTQRIKQGLRDTDLVARWGGEEFAVLAPCTPISGAEVLAEKIRRIVAEQDFDIAGGVTISLGVAQMLSGETAAHWIARADELLYDAKRSGRNRVCSRANPEERSTPYILSWGDQFLVHHPTVDAEHAELFRLTNELILSDPHDGRAELQRRMDRLQTGVAAHFASEELILAELGCPAAQLEQHALVHHSLAEQLLELRRRFDARRVDLHDYCDFVVRRIAIGHLTTADPSLFNSLVRSATIAVHDDERPSLRIRIQRALLG